MRKLFFAAILATTMLVALAMGVGADTVVGCCN
jgi:hypothetical protein